MRVGLAAYGLPCSLGLMGDAPRERPERVWDALELLECAARLGLAGVELPPRLVSPTLAESELAEFAARARGLGLFLVADTGGTEPESLSAHLHAARALGAKVLRTTLSPILEGERAKMKGGWSAHLEMCAANLQQVMPLARELAVAIAVENHQDVTSFELVALCERLGGQQIGVTLDSGNPLAVGELPHEFLRRVAPFLKNVHWKDYTISHFDRGYCLQRCALGEGDVNFPALFALVDALAPEAYSSVELAAHRARRVRVLDEDWWDSFAGLPHRDEKAVVDYYRQVARASDMDWRSVWDRGVERGDALAASEQDELHRSVEYLRREDLLSGA